MTRAGKCGCALNSEPGFNRTKIVVTGPGAIGCLFGAMLAEAGHDVTLLDHKAGRARQLSAQGITIQTNGSSRQILIPATIHARTIGITDVLLLCVKSYDTRAALSNAAPVIGPQTIVVSMQNGLGNGKVIARSVAPSRIACGVTEHGAVNLEPGLIIHAGAGKTRIAPFNPASGPIARQVAVLLRSAAFDAAATKDFHGMIWSKLVINAAINPLTAILNVPNGYLLDDPAAKKTMFEAADEAAAVAKAKGISLMFRNPRNEVEAVCGATSKNVSSMLHDVRLHRKTEIGVINGAIVKEARIMGIAVPVNRMLVRRVMALS